MDPDASADSGMTMTDAGGEACAEDEFVSSGVCTPCPAGEVNAEGDDPSGPDTTCFQDDSCYQKLGVDCDAFEEAYIKADEVDNNDIFGSTVVMSDDGTTLVVGAHWAEVGPNADTGVREGAVYVFRRDGVTWTQEAALQADSPRNSTGEFGRALALDGDTLVTNATLDDAVYVFERSNGTWSRSAILQPANHASDDGFGRSVSLQGDTLVVGAMFEDSTQGIGADGSDNSGQNRGAAYVFERSNGTWTESFYLKPSTQDDNDQFGQTVVIDGDTIAVTSSAEASNATGVNGDETNNDASESGAVWVFVRSGNAWVQEAYLKASNTGSFDGFGDTLALEGDTLAVGAPTETSIATGVDGDQTDNQQCGNFPCRIGAVYVFTRTGTTWSQQAYIKPTNTIADSWNFGIGLDLTADGNLLAVGAQTEDSIATGLDGQQNDTSGENMGAAYLYRRDAAGAWAPYAYVKPFHAGLNQRYGTSVALDALGHRMATGAPIEAGTSTGINGDLTMQGGAAVGAVYVNRLAR
jgi:hypothetical protein